MEGSAAERFRPLTGIIFLNLLRKSINIIIHLHSRFRPLTGIIFLNKSTNTILNKALAGNTFPSPHGDYFFEQWEILTMYYGHW